MDRESGNRVGVDPGLSSTAQSVAETRIAIEVGENSVDGGDEEKGKGTVNFGEDLESNLQRVCRICHLNTKEEGQNRNCKDLVELGCGCKGELGFAHLSCAETWFKLKGNRLCEICGEIVKNIRGVGDASFMEEWNDGGGANSAERGRGCLGGRPFCNFLMGCLVLAVLLPWFLRVDIF